jgi:hypothetical protein
VLGALAYPASIFIFIIGASQDPKKVGYSFLNNLKRFGFQGLSPAAREPDINPLSRSKRGHVPVIRDIPELRK